MSFLREILIEKTFNIQCLLHKNKYKSYIYYIFNYNLYRYILYILFTRFKNKLCEENILKLHEIISNEGK